MGAGLLAPIGDGQYQWTSGYWADTTTAEVTYIPTAPPASLDAGPNIEAPSEDHSWIPGNWVWLDNRYAWRPGCWLPLREDWTWVPSRYCWSPGGYVYVDGYWDYAVACRGVLFAPVYFPRPVYDDPGYYYTPSIVIAARYFRQPPLRPAVLRALLFRRLLWRPVIAMRATMPVSRGIPAIAAMIRSTPMTGGATAMTGGGKTAATPTSDTSVITPTPVRRTPGPRCGMAAMTGFNDGRNRMFASTLASVTGNPAHRQRFSTLDRDAPRPVRGAKPGSAAIRPRTPPERSPWHHRRQQPDAERPPRAAGPFADQRAPGRTAWHPWMRRPNAPRPAEPTSA